MDGNGWQSFINVGFMLITFLAGFILKSIWGALTQLQKDLSRLQEKIGEDYVRRDDFQILAAEIRATLVRIETKLDGKADR